MDDYKAANTGPEASDAAPQGAPSRGMSRWRWVLFSIMAQLESREEVYLNIPNAVVTPHDVAVGGDRGDAAR